MARIPTYQPPTTVPPAPRTGGGFMAPSGPMRMPTPSPMANVPPAAGGRGQGNSLVPARGTQEWVKWHAKRQANRAAREQRMADFKKRRATKASAGQQAGAMQLPIPNPPAMPPPGQIPRDFPPYGNYQY